MGGRALLGVGLLLGCGGSTLLTASCAGGPGPGLHGYRIAPFSAEITPPVGHPLCGGMVAPAARIEDPLFARGFILWGGGEPVVVAALDWTGLRNEAFDRWRSELTTAAGTLPARVFLRPQISLAAAHSGR